MAMNFFNNSFELLPKIVDSVAKNVFSITSLLVLSLIGTIILLAKSRHKRLALMEKFTKTQGTLDTSPESWITLHAENGKYRISGFSNNTEDLLGIKMTPPFRNNIFFSVLNESVQKELDQHIQSCFKKKKDFRCDAENIKNGNWVQIKGHFNVGDTPQVILWLKEFIPQQKIDDQNKKIANLSLQNEFLEKFLQQLPIPIWSRDEQLKLTYCNPAYARAVGASVEETLSGNRQISSTVFGQSHEDIARKALSVNDTASEMRAAIIDGERKFLKFSEFPMEHAPLGGYALDMTSHEKAESDLKRHISAHRETLSLLSTAVAIYGPDMRLQFFNKNYQKMFGGPDDSWLFQKPTIAEVIDKLRELRLIEEVADFAKFKQDEMALFTSLLHPLERLRHQPNGRTIRMIQAPHPLGGLIFLIEDVTDSLTMEREYNTLTAVQRSTIDHLSEGIAVFSNSGILTLSNPAFRKIWGLKAEEIHNQHISHMIEQTKHLLVHEGPWDEHKKNIINRMTNRVTKSKLMERVDGMVLKISYIPLPDGSHLITYLDVTDSIHVERALRDKNDALQTADKIKSEFISNVSYQLRSPLNTIMGFSEILSHEFFGPVSEKQKEYCLGILECSQQLLSQINDILDLSSIQAGKIELIKSEFCIQEVLNGCVDLVKQKIQEGKLTLSVEYDEGSYSCYGDKNRLKQAFFNLLNTAIQSTQENGVVNVSLTRYLNNLCVVVSDSGQGLDTLNTSRQDIQKDLANGGFYQSDGLGLPLVKSLVELHEGEMEVYSHKDAGTTVICQLPIAMEDTRTDVQVA